jgi:hypothetical protein
VGHKYQACLRYTSPGYREAYKAAGKEEERNSDLKTPSRFHTGSIELIKNGDSSFKVTSTEVRLGVYTSSGYHPDRITTLDQRQLALKGYMQSPNDWKNVEMTGYFRINSFTDSIHNGPILSYRIIGTWCKTHQ